MEISRTAEWRAMIEQLTERNEQLLEGVLHAARHDETKVQQEIGKYDGFRMAIEYIKAIGSNDVE